MADEATTPDPADAAQPTQDTPPIEQTDATDWKAEARKWEARSKENAAAAKKLQSIEDANKSETERLTERATKAEETASTWQGRYFELAKRQAITEAATNAQATDPETVYLYLREEVEIDDDGTPVGVEKALKGLQQRKPHLFRSTPEGARDAFATNGKTPPALNSDGLVDALTRAVGAAR